MYDSKDHDYAKLIRLFFCFFYLRFLVIYNFIRNLTPAERQTLQVKQQEVGSCLVAVARLQNFGETTPKNVMSSNDKEFVTRIGTDGRFTYVDQRYFCSN